MHHDFIKSMKSPQASDSDIPLLNLKKNIPDFISLGLTKTLVIIKTDALPSAFGSNIYVYRYLYLFFSHLLNTDA